MNYREFSMFYVVSINTINAIVRKLNEIIFNKLERLQLH